MSKGFEVLPESSGSTIQCKQKCKQRKDCAAFAYDSVLCYIYIFEDEIQDGFMLSTFKQQEIDPVVKEKALNFGYL